MTTFDPHDLPDGAVLVPMSVGPDGLHPETTQALLTGLVLPAFEAGGAFGAPKVAADLVQLISQSLWLYMREISPSAYEDEIGGEFSPKAFLAALAESAPDHDECVEGLAQARSLSPNDRAFLATLAANGGIDAAAADVVGGFEKLLADDKPPRVIEADLAVRVEEGTAEAERYNAQREREQDDDQ